MIFDKGEEIVREGESSNHFYVLMKGNIGVYKGNILVGSFSEPGVIIGEMSAILGKTRTATLRALETTTVVPIPSDIDLLIADHPDIAKDVMLNLAKNLERMTSEYFKIASHEESERRKQELFNEGSFIVK